MKLPPAKQEPIVAMLTRIYQDIRAIEEEFQLLVGGEDFRPRIEYFHDAIRSFTQKDVSARDSGGRLSVEMLAYDLSCLRYLQEMPLSPFTPHGELLSPRTDLVRMDSMPVAKAKRPDRSQREQLSELYKHYALLYAALMKAYADSDYDERVRDLNQEVATLHAVLQQFEQLAKGKGSAKEAQTLIAHLEGDELKQALNEFLQKKKYTKKDDLSKAGQGLKKQAGKHDKEIAGIEAAHLNYVMAQLSIFENSKDVLKKMAKQGMNVVGQFVESAIAESNRQMGR